MPKKENTYKQKPNGKNDTGRPTKYLPEYCQSLVRWFDLESFTTVDITVTNRDGSTKEFTKKEATPLPMLVDFAKSIGVSYMTVHRWAGLDPDTQGIPEFCDAYKEALAHRDRIVIQNGLQGTYNAYFAKFFAENCMGWKESNKTVDLTPETTKALSEFNEMLNKVYGKKK